MAAALQRITVSALRYNPHANRWPAVETAPVEPAAGRPPAWTESPISSTQVVATTNPKIGIHTRLTGLGDEAGAGPFFDMLAAHTYGAQAAPETLPDPAMVNFRRVELLHDLMATFGDAKKQVIITEGGWNDSLRWTNAVLPSQRLRWTVDAYAMGKQWDWLAAMCLWQFATPWSTHTYQDNWSFVAADGTPKAIYWAVRAASRGPDDKMTR